MPSRSDLFAAGEKLLKQAGAVTVWRGPFFPKDHGDMPMSAYPLASWMDSPNGEQIESGNIGFRLLGTVQSQIWIATGELAGAMVQNPGPWKQLDDFHDAIMDQLSDAYRGELPGGTLTSQISIIPDPANAWDPGWYSLDTAHIGAILSLNYAINFGRNH